MLSVLYFLPEKKGDDGFSNAYIILVLELVFPSLTKAMKISNGGHCHGTKLSEVLKSQIMFNHFV